MGLKRNAKTCYKTRKSAIQRKKTCYPVLMQKRVILRDYWLRVIQREKRTIQCKKRAKQRCKRVIQR